MHTELVPGDVIVICGDKVASLWQTDCSPSSWLIASLQKHHRMLVISIADPYALVLVDNVLGYVNHGFVTKVL